MKTKRNGLVQILLVEDNPGDIRLTQEALKEGDLPNNLNVVKDGVEAVAYLRKEREYADKPRPDLILLDLNLPKKDGREVLAEIKEDDQLKHIPVVILTTSDAEQDIIKVYKLHANCFITKPVDLDEFMRVVRQIEDFWFGIVQLPPNNICCKTHPQQFELRPECCLLKIIQRMPDSLKSSFGNPLCWTARSPGLMNCNQAWNFWKKRNLM